MNIREKIQSLMDERGISAGQLARDAGLDYLTVYRWLNEIQDTSTKKLEKILFCPCINLRLVDGQADGHDPAPEHEDS